MVQPIAIIGFSLMKYTIFASFIVHVRALATSCPLRVCGCGVREHTLAACTCCTLSIGCDVRVVVASLRRSSPASMLQTITTWSALS